MVIQAARFSTHSPSPPQLCRWCAAASGVAAAIPQPLMYALLFYGEKVILFTKYKAVHATKLGLNNTSARVTS
jgi:hypothetical protein